MKIASIAMIGILTAGLVSLAPAQTAKPEAAAPAAPAAKSAPLSADQQGALKSANERLAYLAQEERAIQAERALLQSQANNLVIEACKSAGAEKCDLNTQDPDPHKWSLTITAPAKTGH